MFYRRTRRITCCSTLAGIATLSRRRPTLVSSSMTCSSFQSGSEGYLPGWGRRRAGGEGRRAGAGGVQREKMVDSRRGAMEAAARRGDCADFPAAASYRGVALILLPVLHRLLRYSEAETVDEWRGRRVGALLELSVQKDRLRWLAGRRRLSMSSAEPVLDGRQLLSRSVPPLPRPVADSPFSLLSHDRETAGVTQDLETDPTLVRYICWAPGQRAVALRSLLVSFLTSARLPPSSVARQQPRSNIECPRWYVFDVITSLRFMSGPP